jgi:hypothetical protein
MIICMPVYPEATVSILKFTAPFPYLIEASLEDKQQQHLLPDLPAF